MSKNKSSEGGIGFLGALALVFIVMKLLGKIDWSWWWVLCPMWILPSLFIVSFTIYYIYREIKHKRNVSKRKF